MFKIDQRSQTNHIVRYGKNNAPDNWIGAGDGWIQGWQVVMLSSNQTGSCGVHSSGVSLNEAGKLCTSGLNFR
jgi:hypothetical protein